MARGSLQRSGLPSILRTTTATPIPAPPRPVTTALGGTAARPGPSHHRAHMGARSAEGLGPAYIPEATLYRFKTHRRVSDLGIREISYADR